MCAQTNNGCFVRLKLYKTTFFIKKVSRAYSHFRSILYDVSDRLEGQYVSEDTNTPFYSQLMSRELVKLKLNSDLLAIWLVMKVNNILLCTA